MLPCSLKFRNPWLKVFLSSTIVEWVRTSLLLFNLKWPQPTKKILFLESSFSLTNYWKNQFNKKLLLNPIYKKEPKIVHLLDKTTKNKSMPRLLILQLLKLEFPFLNLKLLSMKKIKNLKKTSPPIPPINSMTKMNKTIKLLPHSKKVKEITTLWKLLLNKPENSLYNSNLKLSSKRTMLSSLKSNLTIRFQWRHFKDMLTRLYSPF